MSVAVPELHSGRDVAMTAAERAERHWQLVARRQRLRKLNAPSAVLERNRALMIANLHAWNAALIDEHLETQSEPAARSASPAVRVSAQLIRRAGAGRRGISILGPVPK